MIEINHCPSTLAEGFNGYSLKARKQLFDGLKVSPFLDFSFKDRSLEDHEVLSLQRISISGVQEKFPAIIVDGRICIPKKGERSTYILKPAPFGGRLENRVYIPANEHLTMQIASQCYDIDTAPNGLCFTLKGEAVYITKRFDILNDGLKIQMEDFASLIGKNEPEGGAFFKYEGSYEDIGKMIKKYVSSWKIDIEKFFNLLVFNYIYSNGDAHLKNFSLILQGGDYRLAPAYDLMNTQLHINGDDLALSDGLSSSMEMSDIFDQTGHLCWQDFHNFGALMGIPETRIEKILKKYYEIPAEVRLLISSSYLSPKLKRSYLTDVNTKTARFNRGW